MPRPEGDGHHSLLFGAGGLLVRNLPPKLLGSIGVVLVLAGTLFAPVVESDADNSVTSLGTYWFVTDQSPSALIATWFVGDVLGRALGMMLIGVYVPP